MHAVHPSVFVQYSKESLLENQLAFFCCLLWWNYHRNGSVGRQSNLIWSQTKKKGQEWTLIDQRTNGADSPCLSFSALTSIWMANLVNFRALWLHTCQHLTEWLLWCATLVATQRGQTCYCCCCRSASLRWMDVDPPSRDDTHSCVYKQITYHCSDTGHHQVKRTVHKRLQSDAGSVRLL